MSSTRTLFKNASIVDPASGFEGRASLLVEDGVIAGIGSGFTELGAVVVDCSGLVLAPGLVDLHAHLRTPGFEYKEDIATGTAAAAAGGFTTVCCMPNTNPCLDDVENVQSLQAIIDRDAQVRVRIIAAISEEREGLVPVDYAALASAGVVAFSDDGVSTLDATVMIAALEASRDLGLPIMVHCEDPSMASGSMNEGVVSAALGLTGIPAVAEEVFLSRDIALAELTRGWLYALHVSTPAGAELIRRAVTKGIRVTGEAMPHHLLMSDEWVAGSRTFHNVAEPAGPAAVSVDPMTKVNPPLRTPADSAGLLEAVKSGVFDVIATDHAPHSLSEKEPGTFETAAMGMSGFEFALPMMLSIVRAGHLPLFRVIELMSSRPAALFGFDGGSLLPGRPADIVVFDPAESWTVTADTLQTKSPNTPLLGMTLTGRVVATYVDGEERFARWS